MIFRFLLGVGLIAAGYYVGREVGRREQLRRKLHRSRRFVSGKVVDSTDYEVEKPGKHGMSSANRKTSRGDA